MRLCQRQRFIRWLFASLALGLSTAPAAEIYRTGFEAVDGFVNGSSLEGTNGWVGSGESFYVFENGITNGAFAGHGQQAFLGGSLTATHANYYAVWRPVNLAPVPSNVRWVRFSALMSIANSSNEYWDDFYWSVYNTNGQLLLSLDFDNLNLGIYRRLPNGSDWEYTGVPFTNDVAYHLQILMDFAANRWHATLDDEVLATNQPLTTLGSALNLGDIDAGWYVRDLGSPGDNRMVFDNYTITTELLPGVPTYRTGFEAVEGFVNGSSLEGTNGWVGSGESFYVFENGITNGAFAGHGQQAFLGGSLTAMQANYYAVWRPVNLAPVPSNVRWVRFSVLMSIANSSNGYWDDFYWSVYNTNGQLLLSLDFDNLNLGIYRRLPNNSDWEYTGVPFTNDVAYHLQILMDFAANRWHATLDDEVLATNQPLTTLGSALNLGDIDAGWYVRDLGSPGDNRMVFDNYTITTEFLPVSEMRIFDFSKAPGGNFEGHVSGAESGRRYVLEFTTNFLGAWTAVSTNVANVSGRFDFEDRRTGGARRRFYRTRLLP